MNNVLKGISTQNIKDIGLLSSGPRTRTERVIHTTRHEE